MDAHAFEGISLALSDLNASVAVVACTLKIEIRLTGHFCQIIFEVNDDFEFERLAGSGLSAGLQAARLG